jgi:hypothetical protein
MIKVFIGGSRRLSKLNKKITHILDRVINKEYTVLVGDANGADKAVQSYFVNKNYNNVVVYCMQNGCRNNLGNWQTKIVEAPTESVGFQYYSSKDLRMALDTNYGFMLWDSKSRGTLNNIINLLKDNKQVVVYFAPLKSVSTVNSTDDLRILVEKCDPISLIKFEKDFNISKLLLQPTLWTSEKHVEYKI